MNEKRCLISYAKNGREPYEKALDRNRTEAEKHFSGDLMYFKDNLPAYCKPHAEVPYQFKPMLFAQAYELGYRKILWLDSTIVVLRDLDPIFETMNERGVVAFHNEGHPLKNWISDEAIKTTGINISENPEQIMACVVGFDLGTETGAKIFQKWIDFAQDGRSFQDNPGSTPGFMAHRHDQAVLSAILHQEKIKLLPYGNLIYEAHEKTGYKNRVAFFLNKSIK